MSKICWLVFQKTFFRIFGIFWSLVLQLQICVSNYLNKTFALYHMDRMFYYNRGNSLPTVFRACVYYLGLNDMLFLLHACSHDILNIRLVDFQENCSLCYGQCDEFLGHYYFHNSHMLFLWIRDNFLMLFLWFYLVFSNLVVSMQDFYLRFWFSNIGNNILWNKICGLDLNMDDLLRKTYRSFQQRSLLVC